MSEKIEPIWVESLMNIHEWRENVRKYPTCRVPSPPQYDPQYYKGGTWRKGMGSTPTPEEMDKRNREIESLKQFHLQQLKTT